MTRKPLVFVAFVSLFPPAFSELDRTVLTVHCTLLCASGTIRCPPKAFGGRGAMEIVELKVAMDCDRCEKKVKKALMKMIGVDSVTTELQEQKVTVMGTLLNVKKLIKQVKNHTGLHATPWYQQYNNTQQIYGEFDHSFNNQFSTASHKQLYDGNDSHSYYSGSQHQRRHVPVVKSGDRPAYDYSYGNQTNNRPPVDDSVATMFSDENVNNCSIM